jgi:hypothetical protein
MHTWVFLRITNAEWSTASINNGQNLSQQIVEMQRKSRTVILHKTQTSVGKLTLEQRPVAMVTCSSSLLINCKCKPLLTACYPLKNIKRQWLIGWFAHLRQSARYNSYIGPFPSCAYRCDRGCVGEKSPVQRTPWTGRNQRRTGCCRDSCVDVQWGSCPVWRRSRRGFESG